MTSQVDPQEAAKRVAAQKRLKTLTVDDVITIDEYTDGLEEKIALLESELAKAGEPVCHAWAKFTHPGAREEISAGVKAPTMEQAFDLFFHGTDYARDNHGVILLGSDMHSVPGKPAPASTSTASDIPDLPGGAPQPVQPEQAGPSAQEEFVVGQIYDFVCYRLVITPQAGNKAKVEFFTNAYQNPVDRYAFLTSYAKPDWLIKKFSAIGPWEERHFQLASDQMLRNPFRVFWKQSEKTNDRGTHYKDLERLEPVK